MGSRLSVLAPCASTKSASVLFDGGPSTTQEDQHEYPVPFDTKRFLVPPPLTSFRSPFVFYTHLSPSDTARTPLELIDNGAVRCVRYWLPVSASSSASAAAPLLVHYTSLTWYDPVRDEHCTLWEAWRDLANAMLRYAHLLVRPCQKAYADEPRLRASVSAMETEFLMRATCLQALHQAMWHLYTLEQANVVVRAFRPDRTDLTRFAGGPPDALWLPPADTWDLDAAPSLGLRVADAVRARRRDLLDDSPAWFACARYAQPCIARPCVQIKLPGLPLVFDEDEVRAALAPPPYTAPAQSEPTGEAQSGEADPDGREGGASERPSLQEAESAGKSAS
ncbi:hypothetical protein Q5752_000009 [Cryptotrichosporon argae]